MNVLLIGKFYKESFATHISETLKSMGHYPVELEIGFKTKSETFVLNKRVDQIKRTIYSLSQNFELFRNNTRNKIEKQTTDLNIDLIISCHDFLNYSDIEFLKNKLRAPTVLWFPDAISNFGRMMFLNAGYDYLFFKDPYIVHKLKSDYNYNVFYLPEACNPNYHKAIALNEQEKDKYSCDITTAGNLYSSRVAFYSQLTDYNIKIWGNPAPLWLNTAKIKNMIMNEFIANEEKAKAFRGAKIVLNNLHPAEIWGVNVRTFEIAACGGFQLVSNRPGLNQLFKENEEIVSFTSINDLKIKIDYFLKHDDERKQTANAGYLRASNEHTYEKRLNLLFDTVFQNYEGFLMPEILVTGK